MKDNGVALGRSGRIRGEGQAMLANIDVNRCGRSAGEKNGSEREELDAHLWVWKGILRFQLWFECKLGVQNQMKNEDPEDLRDKLYQGGCVKCQANISNEMTQKHEAAHLA